jgi:hypothetical protein
MAIYSTIFFVPDIILSSRCFAFLADNTTNKIKQRIAIDSLNKIEHAGCRC